MSQRKRNESLKEHEAYWDDRARKFGEKSQGFPAVCSYGMPDIYNEHIHRLQRNVLESNLDVETGMKVLDAGCGVGRWTIMFAERGAASRRMRVLRSPSILRSIHMKISL